MNPRVILIAIMKPACRRPLSVHVDERYLTAGGRNVSCQIESERRLSGSALRVQNDDSAKLSRALERQHSGVPSRNL